MTTKTDDKKNSPAKAKSEAKKAPAVAAKVEPKKAPAVATKAEPKKAPALVPAAAPLVKQEAKPEVAVAACHVAWVLLGPALDLALRAGDKTSVVPADGAVRLEITEGALNVQAGIAPDLFFEVNASVEEEGELAPVFVNATKLRELFVDVKGDDVMTLGRAADGKGLLVTVLGKTHELPTLSGEGFVKPLLDDDEDECDGSARLVYDAALLRSASSGRR